MSKENKYHILYNPETEEFGKAIGVKQYRCYPLEDGDKPILLSGNDCNSLLIEENTKWNGFELRKVNLIVE